MGSGICFDERYEPITCRVHYSTDTNLTSGFAVLMIMLQNVDELFLTFAFVFNISSAEVAVIAIVSANWTNALLFA